MLAAVGRPHRSANSEYRKTASGTTMPTVIAKIRKTRSRIADHDTTDRHATVTNCSSLQIGHTPIQTRPLGVKTGQYPLFEKNILRTENK